MEDSFVEIFKECCLISFHMLIITVLFFLSLPPETFRKSSLGNDETEKEKKKFLGFFKVNKRSSSKVMD